MMRKFQIILFPLAFIALNVSSQTKVFHFLQNNADTTIALQASSNWGTQHPYFYLSKKGDTINLYRYGESFDPFITMPIKIRDSVAKATRNWEASKVGINRFFTVLPIKRKEAELLWRAIMLNKPWQIVDDATDGEGCASNNEKIYDGGYVSLDLITKDSIRHLNFYAPAFYEKQCPGRKGRQRILEIQKLLGKYFVEL